MYRKTATVKAWLLTQHTPLTTVLDDGTRETDRVAPARHRVVSIAATLRSVLADAARHDTTPHDIATDRARERLRRAPSASDAS